MKEDGYQMLALRFDTNVGWEVDEGCYGSEGDTRLVDFCRSRRGGGGVPS